MSILRGSHTASVAQVTESNNEQNKDKNNKAIKAKRSKLNLKQTAKSCLSYIKSHKLKSFLVAFIVVALITGAIIFINILNNNGNKRVFSDNNNPVVKEYQEKLPELKSNAESKPDDLSARKSYAVALYATGNYSEAEKQYEAATKISSNDSSLYNNLGNAYRDNGKTDQAIASYKKAIELNKTSINPYVNLANLQLYTKSDADAAISTYKQALEALPNNDQIELLLGIAYEEKGDKDNAKSTYQNILSRSENNQAAKSRLEKLGE